MSLQSIKFVFVVYVYYAIPVVLNSFLAHHRAFADAKRADKKSLISSL
jgi:hypothetical protein